VTAITDWPLTLEQFEALPEASPALEFDPCAPDGPLITQKMSPTDSHSTLQLWLTNWLNQQGRGRARQELRVRVGGRSRVPDVSYWSSARIPRGPDGRPVQLPEHPPEVAIEIASPREDLDELRTKCREYVEGGSRYALLVEPAAAWIELFRAGEPGPVAHVIDEPVAMLDLAPLSPGALRAALEAD
jgi:Uma2 family endonuclease